ncbi:MAG: nicotinate-nucleotide--dimethylbenzimidazole phosphoribosyltransferase [Acidimicrobiia bacterium]|nr:nicotinate-nucleotide--dimethylbenzimidazole phosphoribosyltransferase [Acidimicrobiia bacterium]MXZ85028.1 nicotinate-nucleotide--dimethylbenzimidazole phosphoribosyltransferase [Acidimicrobiia bacterium]MYB09368.1 nicotinate-nucleotide--dimethylbenzimidazole phosphoribosyltransferase [Acidimicrobiia bacterium]MYE72489.1 nicotinate-nucleotide--dimethylbenzimidazole phosphoribosyltransferase [Acidimicrobiia bacterium]MYG58298.1 nicotinate-nucleotide--dimethylbenzimidazole phosphoribosyltrans
MDSGSFPTIPPLDVQAMEQAQARWATRAMPPGALGRLQDLGVHLAGIAGVCPPPAPCNPVVVVFAGDHGVVADGASAWPSEITAAMVATVSDGGAAISVFADAVGADVVVVDVGVQTPLDSLPGVRAERVANGTASIAAGAAMTVDQAGAALAVGVRIASQQMEAGADCLIGGDLGIGNTTSAAALIGAFTGRSTEEVTGTGAGVPAKGIDHKRKLVATGLKRAEACGGPLEVLATVGGLEIAALAGFYIAAARGRVPYIVDGVIAGAALCAADALVPGTAAHAVPGHRSSEPAASIALDHLGLEPLLDLGLRLGEGTGACLAFPLVQAAATALADMADLPEPVQV